MHRIPLQLPTPSITWDKSQPEHILFEQTLNPTNVKTTEIYLTILEDETETFIKRSCTLAGEQLKQVNQLLHHKSCDGIVEGLRLLNSIVLRAPRDSPSLAVALKLRGNWYFQRCCFEGATNDFSLFLYIHTRPEAYEELCEVHGNLVISFYLMRQYSKAKRHLRAYNKYKAKLPLEHFYKTNLEKIEAHISNFASELDIVENIVPDVTESKLPSSMPFKGFNTSKDIPGSSDACYFINHKPKMKKPSGVYANRNIPRGSIVLMEEPLVQGVNAPFMQCELCLQHSDQSYTCLNCRYKTYCSLKCIENDMEAHQQECVGYKYLILLVLDARDLFRTFLRVSNLLEELVFSYKVFRTLTTAEAVMENVKTTINELEASGIECLKLLNKEPLYHKLSSMQYSTLVVTACRLAIFIDKKTGIIDTYYKKLKMPHRQKLILVGVILMRLHCHILNYTFDFEYSYPLNVIKPRYDNIQDQISGLARTLKPQQTGAVNAAKFYDVNEAEIVQRSNSLLQMRSVQNTASVPHQVLTQTQLCSRIERPISTYKDKIAELYFNPNSTEYLLFGETADVPSTDIVAPFVCARIADMSDLERCNFVQKFVRYFHLHFVEYFLQLGIRHNSHQQVLTLLCTTLSKFRHSCVPNVEVVVLENGVVMGKTLREIIEGEELVISYKAHYMRHTRIDRELFLQRLNVKCRCKYCRMPKAEEPTNIRLGIFCENCKTIKLTPVDRKCPKCRVKYNELLPVYTKKMLILDDEIKHQMQSNGDERELYVLHMISFYHAKQFFVPCYESRIRVELQYAKFLALKNFAQQSYDIIMEVKANIMGHYEETFIWFSFYADMLLVIKIILFYNLEERLCVLRSAYLEELCELGLHIVNSQKHHISLYETFDYDSALVMDDLRLFMKWKQQVLYNHVMPENDTSTHKNQNKENMRTVEVDEMPNLSKLSL